MELEAQVKLTDDIREKLMSLKGERIEVRANLGRSKIAVHKGKITGIYPSIFTMDAERKRGKTSRQSFLYVDILTGVVETYYEDGEPIFGEFIVEEPDPAEIMLGGTAEEAKEVLAAAQNSGEEMLGEALPPQTEGLLGESANSDAKADSDGNLASAGSADEEKLG